MDVSEALHPELRVEYGLLVGPEKCEEPGVARVPKFLVPTVRTDCKWWCYTWDAELRSSKRRSWFTRGYGDKSGSGWSRSRRGAVKPPVGTEFVIFGAPRRADRQPQCK
jgi:hypothetical protein